MIGFHKITTRITPTLYWTSRATDFDKEIWYESEPGCCEGMWFPFAEKFMRNFPKTAVRTFWLCIMIHKLIAIHPPLYPNLICIIERRK